MLLKKLLTGTLGFKGTLILEHRDKDGNLLERRIEG